MVILPYKTAEECGFGRSMQVKKTKQLFILFCLAFGWWGVLFPQLAMTKDVYCIVSEDGTAPEQEDMQEWDFEDKTYEQILKAGSGKVRFKSGL